MKDNEWVSQAEAAKLRGVSRQAISRLVKKGRFRCIEISGCQYVNKNDVLRFKPRPAGRPKGRSKNGSP